MDGYCDVVIMGDGFGQKLGAKFTEYATVVKQNLLRREPFTTDASKLRFWFINSRQSLNCATLGGIETALVCSWDKIRREVGTTPMDVTLILSWKSGYGGAVGTIAAVGLNQFIDPFAGDPNYCTFDISARALDGKAIHELGHAFGCEHDFTSDNVMSYGTNGSCFITGKPFTLAHQQLIHDFIIAKSSV